MKIYKIRRKTDGWYSMGGVVAPVEFSKKGKTWNSMGDLNGHLSQLADVRANNHWGKFNPDVYAGCEIVEIEVNEGSVLDVREHLLAMRNKRIKEMA